MRFLARSVVKATDWGTDVGAVVLAAIMFLICANVAYRIFGGVIPGAYDLVETLIVATAIFSVVDAELHKGHTNVDMVTMHLPVKVRLWLENFCNAICLVFWGIVGWASLRLTLAKAEVGETTEVIGMSIIPFRWIWVTGLALLCLVILMNMGKVFKQLGEKTHES